MDELLTTRQCAYLLNCTKRNIEMLIQKKKLKSVRSKKRILVESSSLKCVVFNELNMYSRCYAFLRESNKKEYWIRNRQDNDYPENVLTVSQCAFLLGCSKQNIYGMLRKNILIRADVDRGKYIITIQSLENYMEQIYKKYERAIQYFSCPDTYSYWLNSDIEEKMYETEQNRRSQ